ncbi:arylsulfatase [Halolamina pelagica]|uniref:Arylsulfatase n=1 Tax=Halolamina pelagica TaxID=699431 RepID=A0A0P7HZL2_9EURY|nr:arylsulfatase [Halolamina pelagica]
MTSGSPSNVLFVVMDTVRKDHLGPYGYHRDTTPGLDEFAEEATVFDNAVAPAPWTLPVHASIFTGMYPSRHGADQENPYLEGRRRSRSRSRRRATRPPATPRTPGSPPTPTSPTGSTTRTTSSR